MKKDLTILLFRSSLFELSEDMTNGIYDYARGRDWHVQMVEHGAARTDGGVPAVADPGALVRQAFDSWKPSGCIV